MPTLPEKTCSIDKLITHKRMVESVLEGRKTQQRRNGVYGHPGEVFELQGQQLRITRLEHVPLGDMTEEDARSEGYPSLDAYKDLILRMHKGMRWDPTALVWLHGFELVP